MNIYSTIKKLSPSSFENDVISFHEIQNDDDLWYATVECKLDEEQFAYVNPAGFTIGRAYLNKENYFLCIIYNKLAKPVGFISLNQWIGSNDATTWSIYIDKNEQGKGYGSSSIKLAMNLLKQAFPNIPIKLAVEPHNQKALILYQKLGFTDSKTFDGDELIYIYE